MSAGSRITDAVNFCQRRGELRGAVRVLRAREPERFRWRNAVASVSQSTGTLRGLERMRVEEPIREVVLDLGDDTLRREVVLDARRHGVDLDRGEVLPRHTLAVLLREARIAGVDADLIGRYTRLPVDALAPIDTAAVVVVGRTLADGLRRRSHRLWLSIPDPDGPENWREHHKIMAARAQRDHSEAARWTALTRSLLGVTE
jgi:hypothetical protein